MADTVNLVWLRDDLRLSDNPALRASLERGGKTCLLYILEERDGLRPLGGASRWWLRHSLSALDADLMRLGNKLVLRRGDPLRIVPGLARELSAGHVFWNRRYAPSQTELDKRIKADLKAAGVNVQSFKAGLLFEPWEITTGGGQPFRVFSPFWKACLKRLQIESPLSAPDRLPVPDVLPQTDDLDSWELTPSNPDWAGEFGEIWRPGEDGARRRLDTFLDVAMAGYARNRDFPTLDPTSGLSPHLRFGEISPRQIVNAVDVRIGGTMNGDAAKFLAELGWREFSKSILFYAPDLTNENWKRSFDGFAWRKDPQAFSAWTKGRTGYPFVDAGMRQLWRTGTMHNRVRMVAASFLSKHLLIDWREGEKWFWDTLVDADPASNPASWQWVAGSGADAAPYFRIFNPVAQSRKFDPEGSYIRQWAPELSSLNSRDIHAPWLADAASLAQAKISLGNTYPSPIVDHAVARRRALDAYSSLGSV